MLNPNKKLNGIKLLEKIKAELGDVLEHQGISDMDLFLAAQQLIDISRTEYIEPDFRDQAQRAGYFSHAVDTAITITRFSVRKLESVNNCFTYLDLRL